MYGMTKPAVIYVKILLTQLTVEICFKYPTEIILKVYELK